VIFMRVFRGFTQHLPSQTAVTIGNFDGVHLGHQVLLRQLMSVAKTKVLSSTVLTFEPHPRDFFSPASAPARLSTLREKLELLEECGIQQVVVVPFNAAFSAISAEDFVRDILLKHLQCGHLVIGDDFRFGARRQGDFALLKRLLGVAQVSVEPVQEVTVGGVRATSSAIRAALVEGQMKVAAELLGRPYRMDGRVMKGRQLGRQLGFPTANIFIRHSPLPLSGVFAVQVAGLSGLLANGVANLGVRPTVDGGLRPILEVHLFDFSDDIYGRHLQVSFLHKLRAEQKFSDLDALKAQIARDAQDARAFFSSNVAIGTENG
jgi:riboflavin kinase / FMN adenylyltransferase